MTYLDAILTRKLVITCRHDFTGLCLDCTVKYRESLRNLLMNLDSHIQNEVSEYVWSFYFVLSFSMQTATDGYRGLRGVGIQKEVWTTSSPFLLGPCWMNSIEQKMVEESSKASQSQGQLLSRSLSYPIKDERNVKKKFISYHHCQIRKMA